MPTRMTRVRKLRSIEYTEAALPTDQVRSGRFQQSALTRSRSTSRGSPIATEAARIVGARRPTPAGQRTTVP